jgi:hypothetical protein
MRLLNLNGKLQTKNVRKYLIKWDDKSKSKVQFNVKQFLKKYWVGHIVYEEFPVYGSRLKVDIFNATCKVAVEVHGKQHEEYNEFFHNKSREEYRKSFERDQSKAKWLEKNGYKLVIVYENEVDKLNKEFFSEKFGVHL